MPLVTLTLRKGSKGVAAKSAILAAVHHALVSSGVPAKDRFQQVIELDAEDFQYDGDYPDIATPRSGDFILIEILWSVGRNVKIKKKVVADIVAGLVANPGMNPEHIMVCFKETQWENWSFGGGRFISV